MAKRGNRPIDPQSTKSGVRGTHGLGDAPREHAARPAAARGDGGAHDESDHDEATGEEHGFEVASAIGDLETEEERARRRERDARAAQEDLEEQERMTAGGEEVLGDPRTDREEARDRGLATERTPGPGPKDRNAGRARVTHLEEHGLKR